MKFQKIIFVIQEYQSLVEHCCRIIEHKFQIEIAPRADRSNIIPLRGKFDPTVYGFSMFKSISYQFHGGGCCFTLPKKICIDFDFGYDEKTKTVVRNYFNPWFIWRFIDSVEGKFEYNSQDEFENDFQRLVDIKLIEELSRGTFSWVPLVPKLPLGNALEKEAPLQV